MKQKIITFCEDFFNKLQINITSLNVKKESDNVFFINLKSIEWDLLIWKKKEEINALQKILQICVNNISNEKVKIRLKINNYSFTKDENIYSFIDSKVRILEENGWEYMLPVYWPYERKKIHSYIAHLKKWIKTKSRWEWKNRRMFLIIDEKKVSLKNVKSKLTIDIDWDNI